MGYQRPKYPKQTWVVCTHPFATFIPSNATKLIIGTFPTHQKNYESTFKFYYGGEENRFWKVLERVFNYTFEYTTGIAALEERENFLVERKIGITDMLQMCYRQNGNSQDKHLSPIILRDVFGFLEKFPLIEKIILTSRTEVYGALGLLYTYFMQQGRELKKATERSGRILETSFLFGSKTIKVLVPHSTSPSNDHVTFNELVKMYETCLS